jgi:hypothetical protein
MHLNVMAKELLVFINPLDASAPCTVAAKHQLFTKSVFVLGFAVSGKLDDEHGNSGEQQQMNPTPLLGDEQD